MTNELFKKGLSGSGLKLGVLQIMNITKSLFLLPDSLSHYVAIMGREVTEIKMPQIV